MSILRSAECLIDIEPPGESRFWTSGDLVKGQIRIDVRRDLYVASIEAQLRCEERGRVFVSERGETNFPGVTDLSAAHFDASKTIWSSDTVSFDIPESGVLAKGNHNFTFEFELPKDSHGLPCSYSVEANHVFNGIFWGVHATIDRESRTRPNYNTVNYVQVYPRRLQSFSGQENSFANATHKTNIRMSRRPSFLARSELQKTEVELSGRLSFPTDGISQTQDPVSRNSKEFPEICIAMQCSHEGLIVVREIVLFLDTTVLTRVDTHQTTAKDTAIVLSRECEQAIERSGEWIDLSYLISDARVYGVPETCKTDIHDIQHTLRVQFAVTPAHKPGRTTILEVSSPVLVLSEATVNSQCQGQSRAQPPPPPYQTQE